MKHRKRTRVRRARSRRKTKAALRRSRKRTRVRRTRSRRKTGGMMPALKGSRSDYDSDEKRGEIHKGVMDHHIALLKSKKILRNMADEQQKFLNIEKKNVGVNPELHREPPTNLEAMKNFVKKKNFFGAPAPAPVEKEPEVDPSWLTAGEYAEADWAAAKQKQNDYIVRMQQNKQRNLDAAVTEWKTITLNEQEEINELLEQASHPAKPYNFKMFEQFMGKNSPLAKKIKMTHGDAGKYRRGEHLRKIFNSIDADSTNTLTEDNFRNFFHLLTNVVIGGGGRKLSRKRTRNTRSRRKTKGGLRRGRKLSRKRTRNTRSRRNKKGGMLTSTRTSTRTRSPRDWSSADAKGDGARRRRFGVAAEVVRRRASPEVAVDTAHREFAEENLAKVMVAWRDAEAAAAAAAVPLGKMEERLRDNKIKWVARVPSWGPYTVSEDDQIALRILKEAWGDARLQANKIKSKKDFTEKLLAERIKREDAQTAAQQAQTAARHEFRRLKGIIDPAPAAVTVVSRVDLPHTDERSLSPTRWEQPVNPNPPTEVPSEFFQNIFNQRV